MEWSNSRLFFLNEPLQKRPVITIQDSGLHSDGRFECHLSWERAVQMMQQRVTRIHSTAQRWHLETPSTQGISRYHEYVRSYH